MSDKPASTYRLLVICETRKANCICFLLEPHSIPGSHISTSFFGKLPTIKSNFPFCKSCLIKNDKKKTSREKHQDVLSRFISSSLEMTVEGMLSLSLSTLHRFLHHHQHHLHHRAQKEKWRGQHPVPISLAIVHHHNQFL